MWRHIKKGSTVDLIKSIVSIVLFIPVACYAERPDIDLMPRACKSMHFKQISELDQVVIHGSFQVHYATRGSQKLGNLHDRNKNDIPDVIEDLILQLQASEQLYSEILGLTPPLHQPRYANAHHINVFVVAMKKGNGLAFDEVVNDRKGGDRPDTGCAIRMYISRDLEPSSNVTPAHELFHLYQYGYAMFKRSWYLEGLTRLLEEPFVGERKRRQATKNSAPLACHDVLSESYSASRYWRNRSETLDLEPIDIPNDLLSLRYVDGRPVFKEQSINSGKFISSVLESLQRASARSSESADLPLYRWPEKTQRSSQFDQKICAAIEETVRQLDGGVTLRPPTQMSAQ